MAQQTESAQVDRIEKALVDMKKTKKQIENLKNRGVPGITVPHQIAYLMDKYPHFTSGDMSAVLGKSKGAVYSSKHAVVKARKADPNAYTYNRTSPEWILSRTGKAQTHLHDAEDEQLATTFEDDVLSDIELTPQDKRKPDVWDLPFDIDESPAPPVQVPQAPQAPQVQAEMLYAQPVPAKEPMVDLQMNGIGGRALMAVVNALCAQLADDKKYRLQFRIEEE